jgi:hypothetical protein
VFGVSLLYDVNLTTRITGPTTLLTGRILMSST